MLSLNFLGNGRDVIEAVKAEACDYLNLGAGMINFIKTAAIVEPIRFEEGHALVPQGPGLGVDWDMDAIEKYGVK